MRCYETWMRSYETRAKRREDVRRAEEEPRRAEDAAREAREAFHRNFTKIIDKEDMVEENVLPVAEKMWQASRSNHTKGQNLEKDLDNLMSALEDNGWTKSSDSSAKIWGGGEEKRREAAVLNKNFVKKKSKVAFNPSDFPGSWTKTTTSPKRTKGKDSVPGTKKAQISVELLLK